MFKDCRLVTSLNYIPRMSREWSNFKKIVMRATHLSSYKSGTHFTFTRVNRWNRELDYFYLVPKFGIREWLYSRRLQIFVAWRLDTGQLILVTEYVSVCYYWGVTSLQHHQGVRINYFPWNKWKYFLKFLFLKFFLNTAMSSRFPLLWDDIIRNVTFDTASLSWCQRRV